MVRTQVSRTVLATVRILIASYFLATATGLIFEPATRSLLGGVLAAEHANLAATVYLFVTAFAIMVGKAVRPAALLLAVYIFWSGFLHYDFDRSVAGLSHFWRDMALLGAILLVAVTEPGGSARFQLRRRPVAPRRIAPVLIEDATAQSRTQRPTRSDDQLSRDAILAAAAQDADAQHTDALDDEDVQNIFADIWDGLPARDPVPIPA